MSKTVVSTPLAPKAVGPYSQGARLGNLVYTAGQAALDPNTQQLISGGIAEQTRRTLENLKASGKIRYAGIALGPAIGWLYEGVNCIRERDITSVQHIYNMLEQHPGKEMQNAAITANKDTMFLIRVTHSSGMLEGKYTAETVFPPNDHRNHRPRSWLLNGVKKIDTLRFLESSERTLGQAALQWLLADERVASTLPNIYNEEQLVEFAKAPMTPALTADELRKIDELYSENFGVEREEAKFKGTMELPAAVGAL